MPIRHAPPPKCHLSAKRLVRSRASVAAGPDAGDSAAGDPRLDKSAAGAGHWPWLDRPELAARLAEFLAGSGAGAGEP